MIWRWGNLAKVFRFIVIVLQIIFHNWKWEKARRGNGIHLPIEKTASTAVMGPILNVHGMEGGGGGVIRKRICPSL